MRLPLPPMRRGPSRFRRRPPPKKKAAPARAQPAKKGQSLINKLAGALEAAEDRNARNDEPNIRNLETQFVPQLQQLLYVELALLRRVCHVDQKPFVELAKAAKASLPVAVREYAVAQNAIMMGRRQNVADAVDPRSQVEQLLAPLVESTLGSEQAQLYREECDKRVESRKRAVVLNLVVTLDERLVLTAEQRAGLVQSLSSNYQNAWDQWLQISAFNTQYVPSIRDESVVPLLDERQKIVWRQTRKQDFNGVHFGQPGISGEAAEIQEIARLVEEASDDR